MEKSFIKPVVNISITKPDHGAPTAAPIHTPWRASAVLWKLQAYGLLGITFVSFFPMLHHSQEYAFFFLLAVALCLAWAEKINPWIRTPIDLPLLGLVGWVLCTVPFATDPAYSFSEWRKLVAHVLVFYWAMFVLRHHRRIELPRQIVWAVVVGSLVLSGYALVDFVLRGGTWRDRVVRAEAPFSDFQWLTTYLVLVIPILIGWVVTNRTRWARALGVLTLVAAGFAQIAAYTRAGWVAHFAQAVGFGLMAGRRRLVIWVITGTIAVGVGLLALSATGYQRSTTDPWTLTARVKTWQLGFHQVIQHPLVGIGYGNNTFLKVYKAEIEADQDKRLEDRLLPALHNTFAMVLMGSGVPAIILYIWIFASIVLTLSRQWRRSIGENKWLLLAIAVVTVGFVTRNLFDYMFAGSLAHLFWILVAAGLCSVSSQISTEAEAGDLSLSKVAQSKH
ncbi:MAG: O-antigen ligase family protein [Nitrospirae bacterium]|nr:O-antigen ligase family protein [Nitrospirota bacterium]